MAFLRLGSKPEVFHREGHSWVCTSGLLSDICINIGEMSFNLHKFPLLSRSGLLEKLIEECSNGEGSSLSLRLDDIPDGAIAFELISKFCYGVQIELTVQNVASIRCAAEYLVMTEDYGDGNLVMQTESFLNEVLGNWDDSITALEACEEVMPHAEELHIVSRCIDSLATKACADPSLFSWPLPGREAKQSPKNEGLWNGISTAMKTQHTGDDWWYQDVSFLSLPLYKRLILAIESKGLRPESIVASVEHYARRKVLHASPSCRENLEMRVGAQLDQASLVDLLIPNTGYSETRFDVNCVQRMLDHFMLLQQAAALATPCIVEEGESTNGSIDSFVEQGGLSRAAVRPARLGSGRGRGNDGFLVEAASDVNFKLPKFESLAATIPDYARPLDDGLYHAIDVYMKAHHWITDNEREQICKLMNCQKLSLEASTHAAQNERLPLRVIVQVLFFEQLMLRTSISGWFFVSDTLENSQNTSGGVEMNSTAMLERTNGSDDDVKQRVSELEKDCSSMKEEIGKLMKSKRSWRNFTRRLGFNRKSNSCCPKERSLRI
ncbi:BTB/POZ domain-containing protein [Hibiscus syriacus]|uniref:BTB/POZ domain-containing protein n=1 Tax=Hibiscus syriacus TaxID=106335 RepID=A0A6A2WNA3_HIBSY|nr:BTB/POZ domain-containing protein [Hibiscus syriacus]